MARKRRIYRGYKPITHPKTGETQPMHVWCERLGISTDVMGIRLRLWPLEEALEKPKNARRVLIDPFTGRVESLTTLAKAYGIHKKALSKRLARGMALEEALTAPLRGRNGMQTRPLRHISGDVLSPLQRLALGLPAHGR